MRFGLVHEDDRALGHLLDQSCQGQQGDLVARAQRCKEPPRSGLEPAVRALGQQIFEIACVVIQESGLRITERAQNLLPPATPGTDSSRSKTVGEFRGQVFARL